MNYAIRQLEEVENILKETIDGLAEFDVDAQSLRENLLEIQTAIVVLQANADVVALAKAQALKNNSKVTIQYGE